MKINQAVQQTGLTQKAIRFYESKGLLQVSRSSNGYRNYTEADIRTLKTIKQLRAAGVSLPDIRLYLGGVLSLEELTEKRKQEILKESGQSSLQYQLCDRITDPTLAAEGFTEEEEGEPTPHGDLCVGVDLGTTTLSAVVYDLEHKRQLEAYSLPYRAYCGKEPFSEQTPAVILEKAQKFLDHILTAYRPVVRIGLTGQMHGIVYLNGDGAPVSNLINWQDQRGDLPLGEGSTACAEIQRITGESVATGYGLVTHYYNHRKGLVPAEAQCFCSIMDLFGMLLCGRKTPLVHASVAASFGLYDLKNHRFQTEKLGALGLDPAILPPVTADSALLGEYRGIPVSVALGDHQAAFLGAVQQEEAVLSVNIGTGSQISAVSPYCIPAKGIELRPLTEGRYLLCGSALCGGSAYAMLEEFFRSYLGTDQAQYATMNTLAEDAYRRGEQGLWVDTAFSGTRQEPRRRGSVQGIDRHNFTPAALILGVLKGMCEELYSFYAEFPQKATRIVASGGAVRRNELLQQLLRDRFALPLTLNSAAEEAATGAAIFSSQARSRL